LTDFEQTFELGPPFRDIDLEWWDQLEQRPASEEILVAGWSDAAMWLRGGASTQMLSIRAIQGLHRLLFQDLFPELAGRLRGPAPNHLPVNVDFGQLRGTPYEDVPGELERLASEIENLVSQLDDLRASIAAGELTPQVFIAAVYVHCKLVRFHPFPNGNGRVSRLAINYFCYRYGLLPIAIERPRRDYIDAIRAWVYCRKIEPFAELLSDMVDSSPGAG
jgi:fido (protein-threonine AMPylation protein)